MLFGLGWIECSIGLEYLFILSGLDWMVQLGWAVGDCVLGAVAADSNLVSLFGWSCWVGLSVIGMLLLSSCFWCFLFNSPIRGVLNVFSSTWVEWMGRYRLGWVGSDTCIALLNRPSYQLPFSTAPDTYIAPVNRPDTDTVSIDRPSCQYFPLSTSSRCKYFPYRVRPGIYTSPSNLPSCQYFPLPTALRCKYLDWVGLSRILVLPFLTAQIPILPFSTAQIPILPALG